MYLKISNLMWWILFYSLLIIPTVYIFHIDLIVKWILLIFFIVITIFSSIILKDSLKHILIFKYRIIEIGKYTFKLEALRIGYYFIPNWKPMEKELHIYNYKNIFGCKEIDTYSTIIYYNSLEECKEAILKYKQKVKEKQKIFIFGKNKVKNNKIIHKYKLIL
jgi:hypothetical protein